MQNFKWLIVGLLLAVPGYAQFSGRSGVYGGGGGGGGWPVNSSVHVQSGGTVTIDSGGTLTCASGSSCPGGAGGVGTVLYVSSTGSDANNGQTWNTAFATPAAAITAAISAGGATVDARGLLTYTISSEIDVGNASAVPVTLILPPIGPWTCTITDGTSDCIKVYDKSNIIGWSSGQGQPAQIVLGATAAVNAVVETAPVSSSWYGVLRGFGISLTSGGTVVSTSGGLHITSALDASDISDLTVIAHGQPGIVVDNSCCGTTLLNVKSEGSNVSGSIPLTLNGNNNGLDIVGGSFTHPGAASDDIVIAGLGNNVDFYDSYQEGNSTDTTTPIVALVSGQGGVVNFYGNKGFWITNSTTAYCYDVNASVNSTSRLNVLGGVCNGKSDVNAVNDHYRSVTMTADATSGDFTYTTTTAQRYNGAITFGGTVTMANGAALGTPTSITLTNATFPTLNQSTTGSAAALSISGQTGLLTVTGLTSTNRAKTVRDAADTILEQAGTYTPTGTWTWTSCSACVWPTFNQNTTGSAATLTTSRAIQGQNFNGSAAINVETASSGQVAISGGSGAALTGAPDLTYSTHTFSGISTTIFDLHAATGTAALLVPSNSTNTATTAATIDFDTTNKNYHVYANGADSIMAASATSLGPTNGHCVDWVVSSSNLLLGDAGAACGAGGGISFPQTVSGTTTSGGIPYFSNTTTLTSSAVLGTNAIVFGGGAGNAPVTGNGDFTYVTHTLSGGASSIFNLGSATGTAAFIVPEKSGNTATAAGAIDFDTTGTHYHVYDGGADDILCTHNNGECSGSGTLLPEGSPSLNDFAYWYDSTHVQNLTPSTSGLTGTAQYPTFVAGTGWSVNLPGVPVNPNSETTCGSGFALNILDRASSITFSGGTTCAATAPVHTTAGFGSNFVFDVNNQNSGTFTFTPTTDTCNGASTCTILAGWYGRFTQDASGNWDLVRWPSDTLFTGMTTGVIHVTNSTGALAGGLVVNADVSSSAAIALSKLATQTANTVLGNFTGSAAVPTATAVATCSGNNDGEIYTSGTGFGCGTNFAQLNVSESFSAAQTIPNTDLILSGLASAAVLGTNSSSEPIAAPLATGDVWVGSSNLPVAEAFSLANITATFSSPLSLSSSTLSCPTCVVATANPTEGLLRVAGSTQTATGAELSGDCTTSGSNAVTCLKTNGTSFTALATTAPGTGVATWIATPTAANLASALGSQTQNYVFASPSGSSGNAAFRALLAADLPNTAVTPGSYTSTNLTVDAQGRITAASNGSGGGGGIPYGAGAGTANAQTSTSSVSSLAAGAYSSWLPSNANTAAAVTYAPNSLTAKNLTKCGTAQLLAGDLNASVIALAVYDGTEWVLQNPQIAGCGTNSSAYTSLGTTGSVTITPVNGLYQTATLTGNATYAFTQPTAGILTITVVLTQASSGGPYTATWTSVKWPNGNAPVMSSGASQVDIYSFKLDGTNVYGLAGQNFQ